MEIWVCVDAYENYRFAGSSTKALDILKEMFGENRRYNPEIEKELLNSFLTSSFENKDEFGVKDYGFAKKVEVEQ